MHELALLESPPLRMIAFFDGQNVLKTANDVFGYTPKLHHWPFNPRKLVEAAQAKIDTHLRKISGSKSAIEGIRFYTGVPDYEHDAYARQRWENTFSRFRNDGLHVEFRELRYYKANTPPREKGIDLRIGLDIVRLATTGACDIIALFSQDTDLYEAVAEAKWLLARYSQRRLHYFCAFPRSADPDSYHGVNGMTWIPLFAEEFEQSRYAEPPKVNIEGVLKAMERQSRKKLMRDFDLPNQGKRAVGRFKGCYLANDQVAVLILEATADLLVMNVRPEYAANFGRFMDARVAVAYQNGSKDCLGVTVTPID